MRLGLGMTSKLNDMPQLQNLLRSDAANLLSVGKSRLCPKGCVGKIFCLPAVLRPAMQAD